MKWSGKALPGGHRWPVLKVRSLPPFPSLPLREIKSVFAAVCFLRGTRRAGRSPARRKQSAAASAFPSGVSLRCFRHGMKWRVPPRPCGTVSKARSLTDFAVGNHRGLCLLCVLTSGRLVWGARAAAAGLCSDVFAAGKAQARNANGPEVRPILGAAVSAGVFRVDGGLCFGLCPESKRNPTALTGRGVGESHLFSEV